MRADTPWEAAINTLILTNRERTSSKERKNFLVASQLPAWAVAAAPVIPRLPPTFLDPQMDRGGTGGAHSLALPAVLLQRFLCHILHEVRTGDFLWDRHCEGEGVEEFHNHLGEARRDAGVGVVGIHLEGEKKGHEGVGMSQHGLGWQLKSGFIRIHGPLCFSLTSTFYTTRGTQMP